MVKPSVVSFSFTSMRLDEDEGRVSLATRCNGLSAQALGMGRSWQQDGDPPCIHGRSSRHHEGCGWMHRGWPHRT
eukprot:Skav200951  [mRNA]  locus=scaffold448:195894:196822:+ [translate_table: standard]